MHYEFHNEEKKKVGLDMKGNLNRKEHTSSISVNGDLG